MNILPKKSWHVRTRDNIARVKRDEALAAEEEKKKEARIALAEQEARTEVLRIKAKDKYGNNSESSFKRPSTTPAQAPAYQLSSGPGGHINFFSDLESGSKTSTTNKDHEKEKKQEQEDYEKKIGLLTYLGQSSAELQSIKPWYQQAKKNEVKMEQTNTDKDDGDLKRKAAMDPMNDMLSFLGKKPKKTETKTRQHKDSPLPNTTSQQSGGLSGTQSLLTMFSKYRNKSKEDADIEQVSRGRKRTKDHKKSKSSKKESRKHSRKKSHKTEKKHRKHKRRTRQREDSGSDSSNKKSDGTRRHRKSHSRKSSKREKSKAHRNHSSVSRHKHDISASSSDSSLGNSSINSDSDEEGGSSRSPSPQKARQRPTIDQLRAERLRREAAERIKTQRLLSGQPLEDAAPTEPKITDKLDGKYNSQFNPHLVRKRKSEEPLF